MKKILIVYPSMSIGGSTTSLLGLLNSLNPDKYSVDLQLYKNEGEYLDLVPNYINILPEACPFENRVYSILRRMFSRSYWKALYKSIRINKKYPHSLGASQETAYARAAVSKRNKTQYDLAIGFLEMWSNSYVLQRVKANSKIAWIHVDYEKSGMIADVDRRRFQQFSRFILVSNEAVNSFDRVFPEYSKKSTCIENILLPSTVISKSNEDCYDLFHYKKGIINFGTVCRIEFRHKGLDRALKSFKNMKELGYKFAWHIIGDGSDFEKLKQMIEDFGLQDYVYLYGAVKNPLPLVRKFDIFLLPSIYEGKPMVITESQMLHVPSLVTDYTSAKEQVLSMKEGLIMENNQEGISKGIRFVLDNQELLNKWKENLKNKVWSYDITIKKIDEIFGAEDCED